MMTQMNTLLVKIEDLKEELNDRITELKEEMFGELTKFREMESDGCKDLSNIRIC